MLRERDARRTIGAAAVAAFAEWLDGAEGDRCADGGATGIYLRNRLEAAFLAGFDARDKLTKPDL